ncbi:MAG: DoxX protein [Verrucomicrobia bacterium]|jgi:hypothetical protein|nr:DoxX protein [Verrucomicrobiota bacterium]
MKHVTNTARYLLALMLLVFGLNKFLKFMPMPELPEQAQAYMAALGSTGILFPLLGIIYLLTAVTLVLNRYAALMLLVLTPVTVNILLFHATLAPGGIVPGLILAVLNGLALLHYKSKYMPLLKG